MDPSSLDSFPKHRVRVGPAGWSYEDWKGRVYPARPPRDFDALAWIARFFDTVEVNSSFYRIPPPGHAESWARRVSDRPGFRFAVKLNRCFTHDSPTVDENARRAFHEFLLPLAEAGLLGPVLAQFPWSYRATDSNRDHLLRLAEAFEPHRLVIELRHGGWGRDAGSIQLPDSRLVAASIDQPVIGDSLSPVRQPHPELEYLRLHGRNRQSWFDPKAGRDARYDYRYDASELRALLAPLREGPGPSRESYVITNNHFQGQAVVNALEIRGLLGEESLEFPEWLEEEFPEIRDLLREAGARSVKSVALEESGDDVTDPGRKKTRARRDPPDDQGDLFA